MDDDERCCGSGHCMIDAQGLCWCGQQWDGEKMCHPAALSAAQPESTPNAPDIGYDAANDASDGE